MTLVIPQKRREVELISIFSVLDSTEYLARERERERERERKREREGFVV